MKLIIDRFEGSIAVCENEDGKIINLKDYPKNTKEGDCLVFKDGQYIVDEEETRALKTKAEELLESLFN